MRTVGVWNSSQKCAGEDDDHSELEEGVVGEGFAVAAGGDASHSFHPGVGAFDWQALAGLRVGGAQPSSPAAPDLAGR
jgi:hypothetical protein